MKKMPEIKIAQEDCPGCDMTVMPKDKHGCYDLFDPDCVVCGGSIEADFFYDDNYIGSDR